MLLFFYKSSGISELGEVIVESTSIEKGLPPPALVSISGNTNGPNSGTDLRLTVFDVDVARVEGEDVSVVAVVVVVFSDKSDLKVNFRLPIVESLPSVPELNTSCDLLSFRIAKKYGITLDIFYTHLLTLSPNPSVPLTIIRLLHNHLHKTFALLLIQGPVLFTFLIINFFQISLF